MADNPATEGCLSVRRFLPSVLLATALSACASTGARGPVAFPGAPAVVSSGAGRSDVEPLGEALVHTALQQRGVAYRYGGDSPAGGFDCSGLVHYVFATQQLAVPRTVAEQFQTGRSVDLEDVAEGDLLFFSTIGPGPTHVGIALGSAGAGQFIHAPDRGGVVRIERYDLPYWRARFLGARRVR